MDDNKLFQNQNQYGELIFLILIDVHNYLIGQMKLNIKNSLIKTVETK